jgi:anaerobic selenocysteine-containing dehydrogenase
LTDLTPIEEPPGLDAPDRTAHGANAGPTRAPLGGPAPAEADGVDTSPVVGDRIAKTTCYMCACRCGIDVHLRDGQIRYIAGNRDHPVNRGVLCGKGNAGIMQQLSPARLRKPLLRTGERGASEFREIEWDEALRIATDRLAAIRATDPRKLAFFTGRDQSQSLTGWWASRFGTPNFAAHGGFCSVNMAAGGLYTIGGAFWEFGEPDWEHTRLFLLFGVAEDHDSNPIKIGLGRLKARGARVVAINPCRTGYNAIADQWVGIRPGTDGLFALALVHELLRAGRVDLDYLVRYTNAHQLVIREPGAADDGLFLRDAEGRPLAWDRDAGAPADALAPGLRPALHGEVTALGRHAVPVFQLIAERYLDPRYAPDAVAAACGVPADTIRSLAAELADVAFDQAIELPVAWTDWAGRRHATMRGRPVSMHAMRGISAHSNGFHTCRALHLLQVLLGTVDVPGGFRFKAPYPKPAPPGPKPAGRDVRPMTPLEGMPLGFVTGPEDLLVDDAGDPIRIDRAFSWDAPLAAHGLMHTVIRNAWAGDPYPIDTLFLYMANVAWNSSMNTVETMAMLTDRDADGAYRIPFIIYSDAFFSETVAYADLVLPDTTYLERHDCISLLDRPISQAEGPGDAIRVPVLAPDRDVRPFQTVLIDLGARLGLPGFVDADGGPLYRDYADYLVNHERTPGIGPLAGWRGATGTESGRGAPNPAQLERYIENGGFWFHELPADQRYYKMANRGYLETATHFGFLAAPEPIRFQLWSEPLQRFRLAARGHGRVQPPEADRARIETYFDPLPFWYAPLEEAATGADFPLHAITQRPMHMYHSWGSQNAWLRQITAQNRLFIHRATAAGLGVADDDWVWIESPTGRVRGQVRLVDGVNPDTVWTWNAIGKRRGAWALEPDVDEASTGFLLNHAIADLLPAGPDGHRRSNSDPVTGQAAWFDLRVRVTRCPPAECGTTAPQFATLPRPPGIPEAPGKLAYGASFRDPSR